MMATTTRAARKIAVVTATRAEYGLLYWLLRALAEDAEIVLQLIVSGAHLSATHGMTVEHIERDGFAIAARVDMDLGDDSPVGIASAMATATTGFAQAFARLQPDVIVLLGDRYEMLAAAQAALVARIPIAHIHGGEATEGAIDEAIRHAITKMSHLHFVAAEVFRKRVIQLGERPERVFTVGAMGLDNIARMSLLSQSELEADLGFSLRSPAMLVTYHPATLSDEDPGEAMRALLEVLDAYAGSILITGSNADSGGQKIRTEAQAFVRERAGRALFVESLGALRFLSAVRCMDVVVGNSSSGLLEAPALGTPTVDIGPRQQGRPRPPSVIHCAHGADDIRRAIDQALSPAHRAIAKRCETPYGTAGAAKRVADVLRRHPLDGLLSKRFYDLA